MTSKSTSTAFGIPAGRTLTIASIIAGSLLIALCAQISIDVPFSPVPITGQTFGVLLVAALLGLRQGTAAVVAYLAEGALGLPVFAGGAAGAQHLVGPTGGYLAGFVLAALFVGFVLQRNDRASLMTTILAMCGGTALIFATGIGWLFAFSAIAGDSISSEVILNAALYPYLPGAGIKILAAAGMVAGTRTFIGRNSDKTSA